MKILLALFVIFSCVNEFLCSSNKKNNKKKVKGGKSIEVLENIDVNDTNTCVPFNVSEFIKSVNSQREVGTPAERTCLIETLTRQDKSSDDIFEWVKLFKKRENCTKKGGIILNRILEIDPYPPLTSGQCIEFILGNVMLNEKDGNEGFWSEFGLNAATTTATAYKSKCNNNKYVKANAVKVETNQNQKLKLNLALLHPLSMQVITKHSARLTAENLLFMAQSFPIMFTSTFLLNNEVLNFSKFTSAEVEIVFRNFVENGLNLSSIRAALRTLSSAALVKLLEMMYWDLEEWEVMDLVEARGGIDAFLLDTTLTSNYNFWLLLVKIRFTKPEFSELFEPFIPADLHFEPLLRAINKWKQAGINLESDEHMLFAILNVILAQEQQILNNLKVMKTFSGAIIEVGREAIRKLFRARKYLKKALEGKSSFLSSWAGSFISSSLREPTSEALELFKSCLENETGFEEYFTNMSVELTLPGLDFITKKLSNTFWSTQCGRQVVELAVEGGNTDLIEFEDLFTFFTSNRLTLLHPTGLRILSSYKSVEVEIENGDNIEENENLMFKNHQNIEKILSVQEMKSFKRILILAGKSIFALKQFKLLSDEISPESVQLWISFQLYLYAAGSILLGMEPGYLRKRALPLLLNTSPYKELIESYPYAFITDTTIKSLMSDVEGRNLLRSNPRLLHNLYDYSIFSGTDFSDLKIDVTKIGRGLHSVPPVQAISKLVSEKMLLDEPINFIGGINYKVWEVPKYFNFLWEQIRFPMLLKEPLYLRLMETVFDYPMTVDPLKNEGKDLIWALIRWSINNELLFREFALGDETAQVDFQCKICNNLAHFETLSRRELREFLSKLVASDSTVNENTNNLADIANIIQSIPLSSHRIAALVTENYSSDSFRFDLVKEFDLLKFAHIKNKLNMEKLAELVKFHEESVRKFKTFISLYGPNEESKRLWLNRLKVVNLIAANYFKSEPITKSLLYDAFSPNSLIPIYERTLLVRTMSFIDQPGSDITIPVEESFKDNDEIYFDYYVHNNTLLKQKGLDSIDSYYNDNEN